MNNHVTVLEIDANAVLHNLNYLKQKLDPKTKILAVVKAFGYGSDAVEVAKIVQDQVDYFAVAYSLEGIELREAGIKTPILVLHPQIQNIPEIVKHRLEPNLYNFKIFDAFLKFADEAPLMNYPIHIFSHLAASEDFNEQEFTINQINNFAYIVKQLYQHLGYEPMIHILNTSGVINYPKAQFDMVRVGIGLYGFGNDPKETAQLKNTHTLTSIISQINIIQPGETVGYNRAFVASQETRSATIPIGHADGISRKLGNKNGFVVVNNQAAPIIGNVCMDMLMIDVTNIDCKEGDSVVFFNHQQQIEYIAHKCETIPYEVLTGLSQRIKRFVRR